MICHSTFHSRDTKYKKEGKTKKWQCKNIKPCNIQ